MNHMEIFRPSEPSHDCAELRPSPKFTSASISSLNCLAFTTALRFLVRYTLIFEGLAW